MLYPLEEDVEKALAGRTCVFMEAHLEVGTLVSVTEIYGSPLDCKDAAAYRAAQRGVYAATRLICSKVVPVGQNCVAHSSNRQAEVQKSVVARCEL